MNTTPSWILVLTLLLALSGWGKVWFDWHSSRPRIRGRLLQMMRGGVEIESGGQSAERKSMFLAYLYLVNSRKSGVHLLDYELEFKSGRKWIRLDRAYGAHKLPITAFPMAGGGHTTIPDIAKQYITTKESSVEFGKPLHGWIFFLGPPGSESGPLAEYRVTCIDAYGTRHRFRTSMRDAPPMALLQEMIEVNVPIPVQIQP